VASPNGRWLALLFGDDSGLNEGVRLVDVPEWRVVGEWPQLTGAPMSVSDDGLIQAFAYPGPNPRLVRTGVDVEVPETVADLPTQFSPWGAARLLNDLIVLTGQDFDPTSGQVTLTILVVDPSTGTIGETRLPGARVGVTELVDLGDGRTGVIDSIPALVWDEDNGRVLVVHATDDLVTELDLGSSQVIDHRFGPTIDDSPGPVTQDQMNNAYLWSSTRRTAALGPGGGMVYAAGVVGEFVERNDSMISITEPSGLVAVDTGTWEIVDRLDAPISDVFVSPDGKRLIATGSRDESTASSYVSESSGLYVIDPIGLEVVAHHPPDRANRYFGAGSYSRDGSLAYVTSYTTVEEVCVVDLDSGAILSCRSDIHVIGEAATVVDMTRGGG
jgi:WD40 repeat protein